MTGGPRLATAALLLGGALLAAGCAQLGRVGDYMRPHTEPSALAYVRWLQATPDPELAAERRRLDNGDQTLNGKVRLALLLTVPRTTVSDENRALSLLDELPAGDPRGASADPGGYLQLGRLWRDVLEERKQLRDQSSEARQAFEDQRKQVQLLQDQVQTLQGQLDALQKIEQQMNRREQVEDGKR